MKTVAVLLCLAAVAMAGPVDKEHVPIVSQVSNVDFDGKFHYSYESADGTKAEQHGELKVFDKEHAAEVVQGQYSYQGPDGQTYSVKYTADENGYHPEGAHLPVAPAIPVAIQKALAFIAAQPAKKQ